jgi:hypothetical protein
VGQRKVVVSLLPSEFRRLAKLAERDDRIVEWQAAHLLRRALKQISSRECSCPTHWRPRAGFNHKRDHLFQPQQMHEERTGGVRTPRGCPASAREREQRSGCKDVSR